MIRVELLRGHNNGNMYRIKCNELEVYLPYTEEILNVVKEARQKNVIQYIERIVSMEAMQNLKMFMSGFMGITQNLNVTTVYEKIGSHITRWGKATPEKRRYSLIAIPKRGIIEFNLEECKIPCIRISCNAKGQDLRAYAKYLEIKEGMMSLIDAQEELTAIKGITMLIKPMNNSVVAIRG